MSTIIVCGVGTISKELIPYLIDLGYSIIVVSRNPQKVVDELNKKLLRLVGKILR
jgi:Trk K+ transport system NAD-binding subunit